jgi:hypothetical protein
LAKNSKQHTKSQTRPHGRLESKRERFDEAGRFPVRKVAVISVIATVLIVGGFIAYQSWNSSQQVGGVAVASDVQYPAGTVNAGSLGSASQTADGLSFSLSELTRGYIGSMYYERSTPMPAAFQEITGGDSLPLLAYVSPAGRLVVATSFCEPCRSDKFHIEGDALVCDTCFTRWDLDTLKGVGGGCMDYPPEEVNATVQGDTVTVAAADLESWLPRAY